MNEDSSLNVLFFFKVIPLVAPTSALSIGVPSHNMRRQRYCCDTEAL